MANDQGIDRNAAARPGYQRIDVNFAEHPAQRRRHGRKTLRCHAEGIEVDVYGPLQDDMSSVEFDAAGNVHYEGVLEPDEVIDILRRYDVVLLPTYHYGEGYPGIILEAYSVGVTLIATRWRALPEIADDGISGLLVEPRNAQGLADAMRRVAGSAEMMAKLSEGARLRAKEFDSRALTERFAAICRAAVRRDWSTVK